MKIRENLGISLVALAILWGVFFVDVVIPEDLRRHGLRPRVIDGLWGIVFSPFLHGNFRHLLTNSGALLVLLTVSLSYSRKLTITGLMIIVSVSGGLV